MTPCEAAGEPKARFAWQIFVPYFILCAAVNYPGRLNEDSLEQFIGVHDPRYLTDLHSPLATLIWSLFAPIAGQPASALLVQSLLLAFFASVVLVPCRWGPRQAAGIAIEILFKASLVISAGFIIKDILLVGLLLSALASLRLAGPERRRRWLVAAAILFGLSLIVRPTNFVMLGVAALALPLLVGSVRGWATGAIAAAAALALSVPVYGLANRLLGAHPGHAEIQLFLFDSAGISARTGKDLFTELPRWPAGLPDPRACYTPSEAAIIAPWGACRGYAEAGAATYRQGRRSVIVWWLGNIVRHPIAYLQHRAAFAGHLLDPLGAARGHPVYAASLTTNEHHYYALNDAERPARFIAQTQGRISAADVAWWQGNAAAAALTRASSALYRNRGIEPIALLLCIAVLLWQFRARRRGRPADIVAALAAGIGIGNFVMHGLFGVASQSRYMFPTLCCALFVLAIVVRAGAPRPPADRDAPA
jgi:hypothetical protein